MALDLTNPNTIQSILKKHNLAPNKFLGQNFLVDKNVLDKIIATADLEAGDNILEVGPGLGTLTYALLAKGAKVVAIEKDKDLISALKENLQEFKNLELVNDDFLELDFEKLISAFREKGKTKYSVISNIPYYITSPVIRKILFSEHLPEQIVFLVQREVAERISAQPGDMSFISVLVQFYGAPEAVEVVKPNSFWPVPEVDSAILKIVLDQDREISEEEKRELWRLVKIGFSSRRKTLANNLSAGLRIPREKIEEILKSLGFGAKVRAQELSVEDWIKLIDKLF
jgi:16S rRNA (adenine1518-N6/adenine1519-N6)-dimethyltransferase